MSQSKATEEAINECKKMTTRMSEIIAAREVQQKQFDEKMLEYQRRKGIRDMALIEYNRQCSGDCQFGGVQTKGCHPMCTNWTYLNPEPIAPVAPVFPDLGAFACTICSQNVDMKALASRDVNIARKALEQQMSCVTNLGMKSGETQQPAPVPTYVPIPAPTTKETTGGLTSTQWIIIGVIIFVVLVAIIASIVWFTMRSSDTVGGLADDFGPMDEGMFAW